MLPVSTLHPVVRILIQAALAAIAAHLRTRKHPAARVSHRIALALLILEPTDTARAWIEKELPKLEREIRVLSKQHAPLEYALVVLKQLQTFMKELP